MTDLMFQDEIRDAVRAAYRAIPTGAGRAMAQRFYSEDELASVPERAIDWALGVGNPVRHARLSKGQVVLDVGSGGGIDTVLAARRVGPTGRVIGLDTLPEMCERARAATEEAGVAAWCELRRGEMEAIPLPDASVDMVISNGVINLSPRKSRVFAEVARVLRPGGEVCVSDLVVDDDLPAEILASDAAWAGCISGALSERVFTRQLGHAGLVDIEMGERVPLGVDDVTLYPLFTPDVTALMSRLLSDERQRHIATSLTAQARKPMASSRPTGRVPATMRTSVRHLHDIGSMATPAGGVEVRLLERVGDVELKVLDVQPGRATPSHAHLHGHAGVILTGTGTLHVDAQQLTLAPGDVFSVAPDDAHAIHCDGPEPLRFVCLDCLAD
jgi:SAM-dependent methyltransferase/quercetin dioxygenase-like cupin family protein